MTTGDVEIVLAVLAGASCGLAVLAVGRRLTLARACKQVEEIITSTRKWEHEYRTREREVDITLTEIDRSIVKLENGTRGSADSLRDLRYDVRTRMEDVEPLRELELLVAQGRIPFEHSRSS